MSAFKKKEESENPGKEKGVQIHKLVEIGIFMYRKQERC